MKSTKSNCRTKTVIKKKPTKTVIRKPKKTVIKKTPTKTVIRKK